MQTCCVSVSGHHTYVHQPWVVFSPSVKQTKQLCGLGRATRASIDTTASRLPGEISISHEQSFSKVNVRASKRRAFSRQPSACFDIWPPRGPPFFLSLSMISAAPWHTRFISEDVRCCCNTKTPPVHFPLVVRTVVFPDVCGLREGGKGEKKETLGRQTDSVLMHVMGK